MAICKLCLQDKELCNSHIIPEYFHKESYDEKHHLNRKSFEPHKVIPRPFEQKGIREKLLCKECELKFSVYEDYIAKIHHPILLSALEKNHIFQDNHLKLFKVVGLDYKKLKLFQLSIIWRCGITSKEEFSINLGKHKEIIREMLYHNDPSEYDKYGCLISSITQENKALTDVVWFEGETRIDNHLCYRIFFGGFMWVYFISSHKPSKSISDCFINPSGQMYIMTSPLSKTELFMKRAEKLFFAGQL